MTNNLSVAAAPQPSSGITGKDVAITAGSAVVGAGLGSLMYLKEPAKDAFVAAGAKMRDKSILAKIKELAAHLVEVGKLEAATTTLSEELAKAVTDSGVSGVTNATTKEGAITAIKRVITEKMNSLTSANYFDKAKTAVNKAVAGTIAETTNFVEETGAKAKTEIGKLYEGAKGALKNGLDTNATEDAKNALAYLKKAKLNAAFKWGAIGAAALAVAGAAVLFFTRGNKNVAPEEAAPVEAA